MSMISCFRMFFAGASLLAAGMAAMPASATLINFDDLGNDVTQISIGYQGLWWGGFYHINGPLNHPNSGYAAGTVSPNITAFNAFGDPASLSSDTLFSLTSFYLTAAWYDELSVRIEGYKDGEVIWSEVLLPSATAPTLYTFNFAPVEQVNFTAFDGTLHPGYEFGGTHFVIDDLRINETQGAVPEPATWALMIGGFGMVGGAMRYRRGKQAVSFA